MDATVWLQSGENAGNAGIGDVVVVPTGSVVKVGDVLDDGTLAWRAEVAPDLLPGLPSASEEPQRLEDEELLRALDGVLSAEHNRGG